MVHHTSHGKAHGSETEPPKLMYQTTEHSTGRGLDGGPWEGPRNLSHQTSAQVKNHGELHGPWSFTGAVVRLVDGHLSEASSHCQQTTTHSTGRGSSDGPHWQRGQPRQILS
uniref:Uncharacterized protein n=1 Tax=Solanum tuberosum TaxID=4113 RepID=M1DF40_SOLTU